MKKCCFVAALLLICAVTAPVASAQIQLKQLTIGRLTYIGDDNYGPVYTITLDETDLNKIIVPLATPITFSSISKLAVVGATTSAGPLPLSSGGPWTTPTELEVSGYPTTCPCFMVGLQMQILTDPVGQPTITITLKNGNTIKTSSTLNVFLTALPGQSAIQLQQFARVTLHSVQ